MVEKPPYEELLNRIREMEETALLNAIELERRVEERTAQLTYINAELREKLSVHEELEKELRKSEETYRILVETVSSGLAIYDGSGANTHANDKFCHMLGYSCGEIVGHPVDGLLDEANRKILEFQTSKKLEGKREPYELEWIKKNGEKISTIVSPSPIFDAKGKFRGSYAIITDISEHKKIQKELRESLSLLSATLESTADGILGVDPEGRITTVNKQFIKMWNIPDHIMDSHQDSGLLRHVLGQLKDPEVFLNKVKGLYANPEVESDDVIEFKDGRIFERYSRPQTLEGKVVGRVWSFRDVTSRRLAQEALRKSEERYRNILESIEDGYYEVDLAGNLVFFNDALCHIHGYPRNEFKGKNNRQYMDTETADKVYEVFNGIYKSGGSAKGFEYDILSKNGCGKNVDASVSLIRNPEGKPIGFRGLVRDITEKKLVEREKKRLETQIIESQKMEATGVLAGGIAHQFNNALTSITGHTGLIEMEYPENKKLMAYVKPMKESALRMAHLTSQLLAYARGGNYNSQTITIGDFVDETLSLIQHTLDPHIRLETDLPPGIPDLMVDRTQMQMVLIALITNSKEAIEGAGRIRVSAKNMALDTDFTNGYPGLKPGPYVCLSVKDDGRGMDKGTRERIFEPFFTTHFIGRGLSMAAAYGIVKNHNGAITVDSEPGRGTTVNIFLPAIEKKSEPDAFRPLNV